MSDDDQLLNELTRQISRPIGASNLPAPQPAAEYLPPEYLSDDGPDDDGENGNFSTPAGFDEYASALGHAKQAAAVFERASKCSQARKKALAKLPFPWVQPALRTILWGGGAFIAFLAANGLQQWWQAKTWLPAVFVALGLLAGENLGKAVRAFLLAGNLSTRVMQTISGILFSILLTINFIVLSDHFLSLSQFWFIAIVAGLTAAAALTLPWFGSSRNEYVKLLKSVESATRKQNEARRRARQAVDKLANIHAGHLRNIPVSLKPGINSKK